MCLSRITTYTRSYAVLSGAGTTYPSGAPEFTLCFSGVRVTRSLVLYIIFCRSLFVSYVLFLLAIGLSALFRLRDSDYPFGIFKLFLILCRHLFFMRNYFIATSFTISKKQMNAKSHKIPIFSLPFSL